MAHSGHCGKLDGKGFAEVSEGGAGLQACIQLLLRAGFSPAGTSAAEAQPECSAEALLNPEVAIEKTCH
jgi:hypothetical protein